MLGGGINGLYTPLACCLSPPRQTRCPLCLTLPLSNLASVSLYSQRKQRPRGPTLGSRRRGGGVGTKPPPEVQLAGTAAGVVGQACFHGDSKSYLRVNKYGPELAPPRSAAPFISPPQITAQQREHAPRLAFTYPSASHWCLPAGSWMATQHAGASFRGASRAPSLLCSPSSPLPPLYLPISHNPYRQNAAHHILIMPPEQETLFQLAEALL